MLSRRLFIKHITVATVFFTTTVKSNFCTSDSCSKISTLKVAGLQYAECKNKKFVPNELLKLKREKENLYDKYAVALYSGKWKVGYIPKVNSRIIASLMDYGTKLKAEVRYVHMEKEPWERLWVSLFIVG